MSVLVFAQMPAFAALFKLCFGSTIAWLNRTSIQSFRLLVSQSSMLNGCGCCVFLQALDGGYLALLIVEGLRGKKLPKTLEQGIMASGLVLLTGLGVILIVRDTLNLRG